MYRHIREGPCAKESLPHRCSARGYRAQPSLTEFPVQFGDYRRAFVDGRRTVQGIRDSPTAEFGPVSVADVAEYLSALEKIGVLHR